ncbi:MAG: hypothetical protein ACRENU_08875, partial [Gemmatimonadaceae bacterium]
MTRLASLAPLLALPLALLAQDNGRPDTDAIARAVASWTAVQAPPGHEAASAALLGRSLNGWIADEQGNLIKRVGSG